MRVADIDAVVGIEGESPSPWSAALLRRELDRPQGLQLVAETAASHIIGWCACRFIWPEAELLKIATVAHKRREGVGTLLLTRLLRDLRAGNFTVLFLEVRSADNGARIFYNYHGFQPVGLRKGYYSDPRDDALILRRDMC